MKKKIFTLFGLTLFKYYQKGKTSLNILAPLANPHIFEILNNYQSETGILGGISTLESIFDTPKGPFSIFGAMGQHSNPILIPRCVGLHYCVPTTG